MSGEVERGLVYILPHLLLPHATAHGFLEPWRKLGRKGILQSTEAWG